MELCRLQHWCLPGFYPFCFPHQFRSGRLGIVPLLDMTASRESSNLLQCMLDMHGEFKLPKHIIINNEESNQSSYLSPNILAPTSEFNFSEDINCFLVVAKEASETSVGVKLSDDGSDDSFFDDEDALYCYRGPAPSVDYGGLSDSSSEELPELPYTRMTCFMDYSQSDPDTVDMGEAGGRGLVGGGGQGGGAGGVDDSEDELPDLPYTRMTSFRDSDAPSSSQHDHNTEYRRVTGGSDRHGVRVDGDGADELPDIPYIH